MKVLGIDPGTINLGWGFIETDKKDFKRIEHGCLSVSAKIPFIERIHILSFMLSEVLDRFQPEVTAIEKIFLGKNVDSAFKLGHLRGICADRCQNVGSKIIEYSPRTVKKNITGSGSAEKSVVQNYLLRELSLKQNFATTDAADALALAFCHILQDSTNQKIKTMGIL
jgi:crossover junction endodeoxyribonuclease RuvC